MFVSPCPHWWQALRVCWQGKPQKHTHSLSYCYSQQSASLIYKYSQHYCPVVPFFFLQNITTCTRKNWFIKFSIKERFEYTFSKTFWNMFNQPDSGLQWWREHLVKWDKKFLSAENTICFVCLNKHLLLLFTQLLAVFYRFFPIKEQKSFRTLYVTFFV